MNCPHCDVHVDEHEASRCLDAWVSDIVMGEIFIGNDSVSPHDSQTGITLDVSLRLLSYSRDISAAWKLIEKLADDNWIISVAWGNGADGRKYASIQLSVDLFLKADLMNRPWTQMDAKALTVPLAICRASIKANHSAR